MCMCKASTYMNVREEFFVCVCVKCLYERERRVCVCVCVKCLYERERRVFVCMRVCMYVRMVSGRLG